MNMRRAGIAALTLAAAGAWANNLQITNVTVSARNSSTAYVKFDISWNNSWRWTNINHDAAWVFFKVLPDGSNAWQHVTLEGTGITPTDYAVGTGTPIEMIVPSDRVGMFVRRSGDGAGTTSVQNVKAVWNFASNSLTKTAKVKLQAFGVEMVYVAEGSFAAGSGGSEQNCFTLTTISTGNATTAPSGSGSLGGQAGGYPTGQTPPDSSSWPNGYDAFYCMKYEVSQGQYADFLNTLTVTQDGNRFPNYNGNTRHTIGGSAGSRTASVPDRACNYISTDDVRAFTDWSGLRPMTDLEFEKACRGPLAPVANEYAWGTTAYTAISGLQGIDGSGTEWYSSGNVNFYQNGGPGGPLRVGIFATNGATRARAGASWWGIMDLSGNEGERVVVPISTAAGRAFSGLHGNGILTDAGAADVANWSGARGWRGGDYGYTYAEAFASARIDYLMVNPSYDSRDKEGGGRAVRTAPAAALLPCDPGATGGEARFSGGSFDGWDCRRMAVSKDINPDVRGALISIW